MPKKLQIKLLSNTGELLNVVNCFAGQVSVFRANAPSDLKPYQRALAGSQGKEKFSIAVDGAEYRSDDHTLIGFGEPPPHTGATAKQYLSSLGIPEGSVQGFLLSYGLESITDKKCSALTADEERRLRLLAATCSPQKVLVINEPFEPIASEWRERFAELLVTYARSKAAVIVVPSLSYRPECWIDNDVVARVQVGETVQRTIGFGSAGSQSNALMNQLKDMLREEEKTSQASSASTASSRPSAAAPAAALAASALVADIPESDARDDITAHSSTSGRFGLSRSPVTMLSLAGGSAVGIIVALYAVKTFLAPEPPAPPADTVHVASVQKSDSSKTAPQAQQEATTTKPEPAPQEKPQVQPDTAVKVNIAPPAVDGRFILDDYPEVIRVAVIESAKGIVGDMPSDNSDAAPVEKPAQPKNAGNLFKLLESASTNQPDKPGAENEPPPYPAGQPDPGSYQPPPALPPSDYSEGDEQARREAIRQKFLEAIRAAAERRQAALEAGQE